MTSPLVPDPLLAPRFPLGGSLVDDASLPWLPADPPWHDRVALKYLRVDPARDEAVLLTRIACGTELPRLCCGGALRVYTLAGRWACRDRGWIAVAGSLLQLPATFSCAPTALDGDEPVRLFAIVTGVIRFVDDSSRVLARESWHAGLQRYRAYCARAAIEPCDIVSPLAGPNGAAGSQLNLDSPQDPIWRPE